MKRILLICLVVAGSYLGGMTGLWVFSQFERPVAAQNSPRDSVPPMVTDLVSIGERFELVAKKVSPAVVYVEAQKPSEKNNSKTIEESGSGIITRLEGRRDYQVLTNHHVIANATNEHIIVHLADGRVFRPARIWKDPESDVAVLGLETTDTLPTALLGDSDKMQVGHWCLAIGSPFGLDQTVTHGIISARERGQVSLGSTIRIKDFLQTDAAINPGSSGGPLLNLNGEVIGINTAIASPSGNNSGVSFSIPINLFKRVMLQLLEKGSVTRGYLGVQLSHDFTPEDALKLGLERAQGALVEAVYPGTPAAAAGLKINDIVLEVDGVAIRNENQMINLISGMPAGKSVALVIWRERRRATVNAVVGDWSAGQDKLRPR